MEKFKQLLKSRKFWAAVIGLLLATVGERAGIDAANLTEAVVVVVTYILGTALEDGLRARGA
jgi:hypothetical protein